MVFRAASVAAVLTATLTVGACRHQQAEPDIPPPAVSDAQLRGDLQKYFSSRRPALTVIGYDLLRPGPTITGIAYPKYYLWVRLRGANSSLIEVAVRVAAINQAFEITNVVDAEGIRSGKEAPGAVFPTALVPEIERRAATAGRGA